MCFIISLYSRAKQSISMKPIGFVDSLVASRSLSAQFIPRTFAKKSLRFVTESRGYWSFFVFWIDLPNSLASSGSLLRQIFQWSKGNPGPLIIARYWKKAPVISLISEKASPASREVNYTSAQYLRGNRAKRTIRAAIDSLGLWFQVNSRQHVEYTELRRKTRRGFALYSPQYRSFIERKTYCNSVSQIYIVYKRKLKVISCIQTYWTYYTILRNNFHSFTHE